MAGKSISSLLEDALDLIGKEGSSVEVGGPQISAAKQLLSERNKGKRGIENNDFIAFAQKPKPVAENPFLSQISTSSVDDPKYWKSGAKGKVVKSAAARTAVGKHSTNQNKAAKLRQAKGEQYAERYSAKKEMVSKRSNLKKQLKS